MKCTKCNKERKIDEFGFRNKKKGTRHRICKVCHAAASRAHYKKHGQRAKTSNKVRRNEYRRKIAKYLSEHPCVDCGEDDIVVLTFDHVRGKKDAAVSAMVRNLRSWESIEKEIAKCDVRCANCHTRRTAKQFSWFAKNSPPTAKSMG